MTSFPEFLDAGSNSPQKSTCGLAATPEAYHPASPPLNHMHTNLNCFFQQSDFPEMAVAESEKAPMTIFYAGKVFRFNDLSVSRAQEIMFLAGSRSSNATTFPSNIIPCQRYQNFPQPIDLPIARKASLTRFLEKRKDRIMARAPYNVIRDFGSSSKLKDDKSWLSLAS